MDESQALTRVLEAMDRYCRPGGQRERKRYKKRVAQAAEQRVRWLLPAVWRHLVREPQRIRDLLLYANAQPTADNLLACRWIVRTLCHECIRFDDECEYNRRGFWVVTWKSAGYRLIE